MVNLVVGRKIQGILLQNLSPSPRTARIQKSIISFIDPDKNLGPQHHLKTLWHKEKLSYVMAGRYREVTPVTVEFVPTLDCNLGCKSCTYRSWKDRTIAEAGTRKMSYETMMTLLDALEEAQAKGVIFTGGGEPFFNPHTIDGLEYAATKSYDLGLFSNGVGLTQDSIDRLARLDLAFFRISFNSADKANYLKFHGAKSPNLFKAAKRNIGLVAKAMYLADTKTTFGLGVVVNEVNVAYMESVARFVREMFDRDKENKIKYIAYRPVMNYGQITPDLTIQLDSSTARRALEEFERIQEMLTGYPVTPIMAGDYFRLLTTTTISPTKEYSTCQSNPFAASQAYDGGLYLCSEMDGNPKVLLGNILEQSHAEIWRSQRRATVLDNFKDCPPACKMHRHNLLLDAITKEGTLTADEIEEMLKFIDLLHSFGHPAGVNFL
ncbi:MAG: radical SAM protein [Candidatus Saganbacteria bacterium]|nr:radical SAM protein [Candidatus Saganbacteria bacterium]